MRWIDKLKVGASFFFTRGFQFLAPIVTANHLSVGDYGVIELAHASASIVASVLSMGVVSVVPLVMLTLIKNATLHAIVLHQSGIVLLCVLVGALSAFFINPISIFVIAALFTALFSLQGFWIYYLRAQNDVSKSLYLESSTFTCIAFTTVFIFYVPKYGQLNAVLLTLSVSLLLGILVTVHSWSKITKNTAPTIQYLDTLKVGLPLMLGGLLSLLATASGRLGIGILGDSNITGTFASLARVAVLPLVAHQLILVARFRDLYAVSLIDLNKVVLQISIFVALAVGLTLMSMPLISKILGSAFDTAYSAQPLSAHLLTCQVILWSGISLNDSIGARHGVLAKVLPWTAVCLITTMLFTVWALSTTPVTLLQYTKWHTVILFSLFFSQTLTLYTLGVRCERYWTFNICAFLGAVMFAFCSVSGTFVSISVK